VSNDFRDILARLVERETRFLVVGAHALAVHGVPRATGDLDLWVEPTPANAKRVWGAFAEFGVHLDALRIQASDFVVPDTVVQFGLPPHRIDILTSISGVSFAEAWKGRVEAELFGVTAPFLGRDALIVNKRATGRHRDLGDLEALER
jgi:hypothetical protein